MTCPNTLKLLPPILASSSPRRKQWLDAMQIPYEIVVPDVDETPLQNEEPEAMVDRLARSKAAAISGRYPHRWIIAADTTVAVDHHVLGKPENPEDAVRMLRLIQGRAHQVHTGLCLCKGDQVHSLVDTAQVFLRPVTLEQARWYAGTGEPDDKAGAYAVQGIAALFIERIEGSFSTVMGFPVERFGELLRKLDLQGEWLGMP